MVICSGTPVEIGQSQGTALRDEIHCVYAELLNLEAFRLLKPGWLPLAAYAWLAGRKASSLLRSPLTQSFPEAAERLRGISAGAGVPLASLCLLNAVEIFFSDVGGCTALPGACSAVAVRGKRSASGEPVIARNFDYIPAAESCLCVRDVRPAGGRRSLEFVAAPMAGVIDGMNENGLCITYDYAYTTDALHDTGGAPISMLIADALQHCATVSEAAGRIMSGRRRGGALLMLADAGGDIASIELSGTHAVLHRPEPGEDMLFHTNMFRDSGMCEVETPREAVFTQRAPQALRGKRLFALFETRHARLGRLLEGQAALGPEQLAAIMADHGPGGVPSDDTPCVHGCYWDTTATLQFFPHSRRVRVSRGHACEAVFTELEL